MDMLHRNLMFLMLSNNYKGTILFFEDDSEKIIEDIIDYDSATHVFTVLFEDKVIMQIPDKIRYKYKLTDENIQKKLNKKPNKKRKRGKRG